MAVVKVKFERLYLIAFFILYIFFVILLTIFIGVANFIGIIIFLFVLLGLFYNCFYLFRSVEFIPCLSVESHKHYVALLTP